MEVGIQLHWWYPELVLNRHLSFQLKHLNVLVHLIPMKKSTAVYRCVQPQKKRYVKKIKAELSLISSDRKLTSSNSLQNLEQRLEPSVVKSNQYLPKDNQKSVFAACLEAALH